MSEEGKTSLIWIVICSVLGVTFGYFFNTEGIKLVAEIWLIIGAFTGWIMFGSDNVPVEPLLGWLMFGASFGVTVALLNYESWLSPLLR